MEISVIQNQKENLPDSITNLHDKTNPHDVTKLRTPIIPVDVNMIVETTEENEKSKNRVASKGKKKITSRGDHSIEKQKEICKEYIKKGKDLSKMKAHIERMQKLKERLISVCQRERK